MSWANQYLLKAVPTLVSPPTTEVLNSIRGVSVVTTSPEPSIAELEMLFSFKSN